MQNIPLQKLLATITLFDTQEGGRKTPIHKLIYRPQFKIGEIGASCQIDDFEGECLHPGETAQAYLTLMHPERFGSQLRENAEFELLEGLKVVGQGQVLKLLDRKA